MRFRRMGVFCGLNAILAGMTGSCEQSRTIFIGNELKRSWAGCMEKQLRKVHL
jgi:hypothetical protein